MITIIYAPPRTGKTCLLTHIACQTAFDNKRNQKMREEIKQKNSVGFQLSIPKHCVSANYDIVAHKFGYTPRPSRYINPYRLGFKNEQVETHFNIPYECIFITEAQMYLNSRLSRYFPDWQSRWYEQHGHDNIDIYLDTQRPMLIDVNIRELAKFIEVVKLKILYDKNGQIIGLKWLVRLIENSFLFDRYMASGKKDTSCYTEETIVADYNVFACYDSQNCKAKFYAGHFDEDFDYQTTIPLIESRDGYLEYLKMFDSELPKNYYKKEK